MAPLALYFTGWLGIFVNTYFFLISSVLGPDSHFEQSSLPYILTFYILGFHVRFHLKTSELVKLNITLYPLIILPYGQPSDNLYYALYIATLLLMMILMHIMSTGLEEQLLRRKLSINTTGGLSRPNDNELNL